MADRDLVRFHADDNEPREDWDTVIDLGAIAYAAWNPRKETATIVLLGSQAVYVPGLPGKRIVAALLAKSRRLP